MQKLTDKHYEDLMDVLDAIEFQKIHKVMNYLDWWWATEDGFLWMRLSFDLTDADNSV